MNAKQVHISQFHLAGRTLFCGTALALVVLLPISSAALADSITATATATISDGGSVGETVTPTPPVTTTTVIPTSTGSTPNTSTVNGGGAKSQSAAVEQSGVTTFRPSPSAGPTASGEATGGESGDTGDGTEDTTTTTGGPAAGPGSETAAGPRLPQGAQPIGNLTGGLSSVAVTGSPNQVYGISLPGQTVIVQGSQTVNIEGFVHNAGETPAMDGRGRSSFNVGAKVAPEGGAQATAGTAAGAAAGGTTGSGTGGGVPANYQGPVTTSNPFMNVIISYD